MPETGRRMDAFMFYRAYTVVEITRSWALLLGFARVIVVSVLSYRHVRVMGLDMSCTVARDRLTFRPLVRTECGRRATGVVTQGRVGVGSAVHRVWG
jgi:hypothetical protein